MTSKVLRRAGADYLRGEKQDVSFWRSCVSSNDATWREHVQVHIDNASSLSSESSTPGEIDLCVLHPPGYIPTPRLRLSRTAERSSPVSAESPRSTKAWVRRPRGCLGVALSGAASWCARRIPLQPPPSDHAPERALVFVRRNTAARRGHEWLPRVATCHGCENRDETDQARSRPIMRATTSCHTSDLVYSTPRSLFGEKY
jgi:hypothetical protein